MKKLFVLSAAILMLSIAFAQNPLQATIAGKHYGTVTAKELLEAKKLTIGDNPCFVVTSYRCSIYKPGGDSLVSGSNYDMLTTEIKEALPTLPTGTKIYFEFIKAKDVNGPLPSMSPIALTIK